MAFHLRIVSAEKVLTDEMAVSFTASTEDGEFQILPGHSPLICLTVPYKLRYVSESGEKKTLFTDAGILEFIDDDLLLMINDVKSEIPKDTENASDKHQNQTKTEHIN